MQPSKFGVGQAVRRLEDDALVRGAGHYVADYAPPGLLHAVMVRSPHAHARFRLADLAKARDARNEARVSVRERERELQAAERAVEKARRDLDAARDRFERRESELADAESALAD